MPQKNSSKDPANQQFVHSVIEQFESKQGIPVMERPNISHYESMTKLSPRTMCTLLDELTQDIIEQFGTLLPVMGSNYLLANEFKNKESGEVIMEETAEVAYMLECGEGTSHRGQFAHKNSEEEDDGMTDIDEEIDLEVERRIRRVSYNNLLK
ncbi:hypothetical protein Adt_10742 [Abeliophyllum distichum]|uniref:Uncharacterized protein n=1 Tax=Abeliophyllum distichum TaxID=126358 RepID=A0ABD1UKV8_9LAMI